MDVLDAVILGAGAAGLVCAEAAALRGRRVLVLDHGKVAGRKVRLSGGGRCNAANRAVSAADYVSANPHFVRSALARFGPAEAEALFARGGLGLHEEEGGKLFCDQGAAAAARWLEQAARRAGARLLLGCRIREVGREAEAGAGFTVFTDVGTFSAPRLVLALGGKSWPRAGATPFGYEAARRLGLEVTPLAPGLVPLVLGRGWEWSGLSGVSCRALLSCARGGAEGDLLFTHAGISGPAALDASLFWEKGEPLVLDLLPGQDLERILRAAPGKAKARNVLARLLPERLAAAVCGDLGEARVGDLSKEGVRELLARVSARRLLPRGTAGWDAAEVTRGGVDTAAISSKTMEARNAPGLHVVGELLDVTGRLGGFNLLWAFASGRAAGESL
ncbi:MAG: aminoacetone oxidase family FAD-binding enzyme [Thermodesulfobacteriota bacterium]